MTEKSTEDRNNIRHYVCTHVFGVLGSSALGNTRYINSFLEKLLEHMKSISTSNEIYLKEAKERGHFNKEYFEVCSQLSNQAVSGIQAIISGEERAVYQSSKEYLIDILRKNNGVMFRFYMASSGSTDNRIFENMVKIFREESGAMMGHKYSIVVEEDIGFSNE